MDARTTSIASRARKTDPSNNSLHFQEQEGLDRTPTGGLTGLAAEGSNSQPPHRRERSTRAHVQKPLILAALWATLTVLPPLNAPAGAIPPTAQTAPSISHVPSKTSTVPPPGSKMKLTAFLEGSNRFEQPMRILVTRDHKLLDIWLPTGRLDMSERPYYETEVYAPAHRISYRFVWYSPDGTPVSSPNYTVERACRYPLTQVPPDEAMFDTSGKGEAAETERLFHLSEALNREILAYQEATRLLGELRGKFNSLQKTKESPGG